MSQQLSSEESNKISIYRIGKLYFTLSGTDRTLPYIREELESVEVDYATNSHLDFEFVDELPPLKGYLHIPPLIVCKDFYRVTFKGLVYQASREKDSIRVLIKSVPLTWKQKVTPDWWMRAKNWNYLTPSEVRAKNFMYSVFDYLSQVAQLPLGQSYLHASSFERDGRGVALIAWEGIGKTTAMLKLVTEDGWRFLSDDLGVIDDSGSLWRTPKRLQISAYNLVGQSHISRAILDKMSLLERASWKWKLWKKGIKGVRRRISAEQIFGSSLVGKVAELTDAFFMERVDIDNFCCRPITSEELARRAATVILSEIRPFGELSNAMYSGGFHPVLPTQAHLYELTFDVLKKAFSQVEPHLLSIPLMAGPDELSDYLRSQLSRN